MAADFGCPPASDHSARAGVVVERGPAGDTGRILNAAGGTMVWAAPLGRTGAVLAGMVFGLAMGAGAFTFWFGRGTSYLTNDPAACANCHIMEGQYSGWMTASHRTAATCNDCHTPHNPVGKYFVKGKNGFWHSFAFTTGWFPEPIRIKESNRAVTEQRCRDCHQEIARVVDGPGREEPRSCITCHASVGHPH